ncbi:MAG: hypothetical protein ACK5N8_04550 [Alphaproteobacteria bacterium]
MISFPTHLPYPTVEGYLIRPDEAIVRTDMEAGPARQRRRYTQTPSKISVKWVMNRGQFSLFEAWYKFYAKEGAEWFYIKLLGGLGLIEQEARFTKQFEAALLNGILWSVSSELEIRDRPTLSEGALGILLDCDFDRLTIAVNHLHNFVHNICPVIIKDF